jgi:hypothetical protein
VSVPAIKSVLVMNIRGWVERTDRQMKFMGAHRAMGFPSTESTHANCAADASTSYCCAEQPAEHLRPVPLYSLPYTPLFADFSLPVRPFFPPPLRTKHTWLRNCKQQAV